jgi:predicted DCC family thiol-disulfide oxidoreductase YuxK
MKPIIVFDGVCGFCNSFVQFVIQRDSKAYFSFASSQSKVGQALIGTISGKPIDSIVLAEEGKIWIKSDAVLRICNHLGGLWPYCSWLRIVPRPIRDSLYDIFARYRYIFGVRQVCQLPTADERKRIDLA